MTTLADITQELAERANYLDATNNAAEVRKYLPRLKELTGLLDYYTTPKTGYQPASHDLVYHVKCNHPGCTKTSADPDTCLLNFAPRNTPALWLCRDHHPKGDIQPVGTQAPETDLEARRQATKVALDKLTPAERRLVNRNIV